jgi:hypothetical protein
MKELKGRFTGNFFRRKRKKYKLKLCGNPGNRRQKMVLVTSLPELNPDKFPLL